MASITESAVVARCRVDPYTGWSYHSRASRQYRYVCVTVPKVAATTLKHVLHRLEGLPEAEVPHEAGWDLTLAAYTDEEIIQFLTAPDWVRFCFVRNPYDRLFSAWKSKIGTYGDVGYAGWRERIRDHYSLPAVSGDQPPRIAFREFVDYLVSTEAGGFDPHWDRQAAILMPDVIRYDAIGRFETFAEDFRAVLTRIGAPAAFVQMADEIYNPTGHVPLAAAYDAALADRVWELYRVDFETFGYERDSWRFHDGETFVTA